MWNSTKSVTNTALISVSHNYNLVYSKDVNYFIKNRDKFRLPESGDGFHNPDNDQRGPWKADPFQVGGWRPNQQYEIINPNTGEKYLPNEGCSWKNDFKKYQELEKDKRIIFGVSGESGPQRKRFLSEALNRGKVSKTWWDDVGATTNGTNTVKKLFDGKSVFTNPKPLDLIKKIIQLGDSERDGIVLDFFAGSGTTAHAVMDLNKEDGGNRRFICVQLPELCDPKSGAFKAGHKTIADIAKERIRRASAKIAEEIKPENEKNSGARQIDLGFKAFRLSASNFRQWRQIAGTDAGALEEQMGLFVDPVCEKATTESMAYELLLKSGKCLNSKIEHKGGHHLINGGELAMMLEKADGGIVADVLAERPQKVIALDRLFEGNDRLKTNTALQMRDAGIEFKTI